MHSKNHRQNHDFQILHFLVGACHTADAAYALLQDLREDRQAALDGQKVSALRDEAKELKARKLLQSEDVSVRKEGEADLLEVENTRRTSQVLVDAAKAEIAFIDKCITEIQPLRKFAHLSTPEANEASQEEEWELELLRRAENLMLTGGIPADQLQTMRMHPAFATEILPRIQAVQAMLLTKDGPAVLQAQLAQQTRPILRAIFKGTP
jgi:hypothetical protein